MSRDKQIEERALAMASEVKNCLVECECKYCWWNRTDNCPLMQYTKSLAEKGYRKSTDVAREIFAELEGLMLDGVIGGKYPAKVINTDKFAELRKKYESEGADDEKQHSQESDL